MLNLNNKEGSHPFARSITVLRHARYHEYDEPDDDKLGEHLPPRVGGEPVEQFADAGELGHAW